ncbi:MAG: ABC transporter substrate-binding protein, partial [Aquincola sp.]|nr:ABC transporter substrate-binding protein [Aquincola sp.]
YDIEQVDLIVDVPVSAVGLAVQNIANEKKRLFITHSTGTADFHGKFCSPYAIQWVFDTRALAVGTADAVVKRGGDSWFFITDDYAFGHSLQADTTAVVTKAGGTVVGSVRAPLGASDFSSFLLQAQGSKAQILGLANAGGDTVNSIKAANEFGITKTMKLAGLLMFINDVHSLGLKATEGMYLTDGWYWNQNAESRAWAKRFFEKMKRMPSMLQAADYSATMHYLKAVEATKTDDADKVMAQMKATKINDFFAKNGEIGPDGRMRYDMYLMQVKAQKDSTEPWDYYNVVQKIPAAEAYTKLAESKCPLVKK